MLVSGLLLLSGCAFLDSRTGVQKSPEGNPVAVSPDGGTVGLIGKAGSSLPGWLGWAFSVLGAAGSIYGRVRVKRYSEAFEAAVRGIDVALDSGRRASVSKAALYASLNSMISEISSKPDAVRELVATIKAASRPVEPPHSA
jgi:hypothetical protein